MDWSKDRYPGYASPILPTGRPLPPERIDGNRASWSRWDTPGTTLFIASDKETAFRECLAWARMTGTHQQNLNKLATLFGETPQPIMLDIDEDWKRLGQTVSFVWRFIHSWEWRFLVPSKPGLPRMARQMARGMGFGAAI